MNQKNNKERCRKASWCRAFGGVNYVLTSIAVVLIVMGCVLMLPEKDVRNTVGGRFAAAPGSDAFDARRIKVAPIACFIGYVLMPVAIMYVPKKD